MSYEAEPGIAIKRARNYYRCPVCGEPQLVEKTIWPAPGIAVRYRACLQGHDAIRTEERIRPSRTAESN